jgi:hypothetical protein
MNGKRPFTTLSGEFINAVVLIELQKLGNVMDVPDFVLKRDRHYASRGIKSCGSMGMG